jgi:UDP-N-acetylglucosamine--N-acetylmuramyl-(pentapeptide) pyrophosphoryl-undecaprenol N-acetylglucosamine transferase
MNPAETFFVPSPSLAFIAAAGTGGHIIPGMAIAAQLKKQGWHIEWIGTQKGMENTLVPPTTISLNQLNFAGLRGKGVLGLVKGIWHLLTAWIKCIRLMRSHQTRLNLINKNNLNKNNLNKDHLSNIVLIGMGGYICIPAAWAAWVLKIPLVLVNADADLLLSNKSLAKLATAICCGFEGSASKLSNAIVTGNPIRKEIAALMAASPIELRYTSRTGGLNILVLGGSLGAQILNEQVPVAIAIWASLLDQQQNTSLLSGNMLPNIWHQSGSKQLDSAQKNYTTQGITATVVPFIDDMAAAYQWADVVICRAGAITISELCAAGIPAILVPLIASTTRHQEGNAMYLAKHGAGIHIPQANLTPNLLATTLHTLNRQQLIVMAQAAHNLSYSNSTQAVVQIVERTLLKSV